MTVVAQRCSHMYVVASKEKRILSENQGSEDRGQTSERVPKLTSDMRGPVPSPLVLWKDGSGNRNKAETR